MSTSSHPDLPASDSGPPTEDFAELGDAVELPEDVYARIVRQVQEICSSIHSVADETGAEESLAALDEPVPAAPESLRQTGISLGQMSDLTLKLVYLNGTLTGYEIARQLRLPFSAIAETLDALKSDRCLEVASGNLVGPLSYRFQLTETGRHRAREAFAVCRYVGPAPVSLEEYTRQCRRQSLQQCRFTADQLREALDSLVVSDQLLHQLGPAVCSGQSIFLYGPTGNGKSMIAKGIGQLLNEAGGTIFVPYAISVDNQIIAIFDPTLHRTVTTNAPDVSPETASHQEQGPGPDLRWREVRRPVVTTGGELSLDMLDLRFHDASGFYTAPLHLKANGGVFLLDDFGRQLVPPSQLLNRWILPLEERTDYLTLATGKKFAVPFEQLIVFSTNLDPQSLVDAAFLRRIRHKIEISYPEEKQFREIFRRCSEQRGIQYDDWIVTRLLTHCYDPQTPPKSSDPRDLLDVLSAICRFRGEKPHLSEKLMFEAFQECLGGPRLS